MRQNDVTYFEITTVLDPLFMDFKDLKKKL